MLESAQGLLGNTDSEALDLMPHHERVRAYGQTVGRFDFAGGSIMIDDLRSRHPSLQLDLIIVAIPKSNLPMQGYAAA